MVVLKLGEFRQPRGFVHRIADHRVLEPGLGPDMPGDRPSR